MIFKTSPQPQSNKEEQTLFMLGELHFCLQQKQSQEKRKSGKTDTKSKVTVPFCQGCTHYERFPSEQSKEFKESVKGILSWGVFDAFLCALKKSITRKRAVNNSWHSEFIFNCRRQLVISRPLRNQNTRKDDLQLRSKFGQYLSSAVA